MGTRDDEALGRLREFLAEENMGFEGRLPPERTLSERLGIPRPTLRKALAVLEAEGLIWRHVGKGTFIGSRPLDSHADVASIARQTNPTEVMRTRLLIEPEVASLAALHATPAQIAEMKLCLLRSRAANSWRLYENWDNRLHRVIAEATQNGLLLALLDTLNAVRRAVTWGRLREDKARPKPDHHSFADHDEIVAAIENRDMDRAREAMRTHLLNVERGLLKPRGGAAAA